MRILYDARFITAQQTGVGAVCADWLAHLIQFKILGELHVLYNRFIDPKLIGSYPIKTDVAFDSHPYGDLYRNFKIPQIIRSRDIDILHNPAFYSVQRNRGIRQMTAIHDTAVFDVPHFFPKKFVIYFRWIIKSAVKRSDIIIIPTLFVRDRLADLFPDAVGKFRLVSWGVSDLFHCGIDEEDSVTMSRWSMSRPYILVVSTIELRKNIMTMLDAYAIYRRRCRNPFDLVIAGKEGLGARSIIARSKMPDMGCSVRFLGYISNNEMAVFYRNARFSVFPSVYEGFGLPVLESMASGCPVIAGNLDALKEISGEAAVLIDPKSEIELADAMIQLSLENSLWESMKSRGIERAGQYSWKETVSKTIKLYNELLTHE